ncbi:MAG TPA: AraC family transcriptional regulator [Opitutales bacterium]|nr:AraC family transcriptional regulator [Opitutales bacterium]
MSKIVRTDASGLLSKQVSDARYFFLNLAPRKRTRLELVMGGYEHCNPDYFISRQRFPYTSIEYVISGQGVAVVDSRRHELRPGVVFAYGPNTPHEIHTHPREALVKYFISITGAEVPARLRRGKIASGEARQLAPHAEIAGAFEALMREGQLTGPNRAGLCAALLEFLLLKIEDTATITAHSNERAREAFLRCKAYIDAESESLHTLGQIARAVGAETSSVCRWFRRYEGISPYQYLLRRRMNLAAERLVEQGGLVKETASRFGFADPFHFSHQFKAVHGISPSQLLRYSRGRPAQSR